MRPVRTIDDLRAVEAEGFDAFCPDPTPWQIIEAAATRSPDAVALRYVADAAAPSADRLLTYRGFRDDIAAAASVFRDLGVTPGRSVALLVNHTPSAQIALWGAEVAGQVCPINPLLRPAHIAELFRAADVAAAVVMGVNAEQDYWSSLVPALRAEGVTVPILDCDADAPSPGSDGRFEDLVAAARGRRVEPDGDADATAGLYHTGGTTGIPKLVRHSRRNQAHVARSCALMHGYGAGDVVLNGFPLFHVAGAFVYGLSVFSEGGTLVVPGRLGMRNAGFMGGIWRQVDRCGITVLGVVPTILSGLLSRPVDADISRVRAALTGGSPLPPELADAFERKTSIPVRNIFGMTETAGSIALESVRAPRTPLCCGFPLPFSEVAVLPHPGGEDPSYRLPAGETGIVAVRGPNVSPGYTDPSRNAGTFLPGDWLLTGDLGRVDAEGRLYLTGRAKDVIIRGSHNIDPQSIEDALMAHEDVESAAAVGMPDAYAGELPVAFVTLRAGASVSADDLLAFLRPRIGEPAAMPKRIGLIDTMPVTPVGKIFKPTLRRTATGWAIDAAASRAGVTLPEGAVDIAETLAVTLTLPDADAARMREALTGMPVTLSFRTGTEA
ncbi:AMP-binding protein [Rhodobacterales bacterium HKCCE2091]|nr:AMP-binding protein [Rhodobacterales bacterium HKCCE2091]